MENELIRVTTNEEGMQCVSARELHEFLEIGQDFTNWIKRMINYGFELNQDFTVAKISEGKVTKHEYIISLDMAKEISMVQRSEKGKRARQYFIQCEKKLKEVTSQQPKLPTNYIEALEALLTSEKEKQKLLQENVEQKQTIQKQETKIAEQRPYVDIAKERIIKGECISLTDITKGLGLKKGQISVWAKMNGYLSKVGTEINKKGEEFFKVYLTREGYKCIGVREKGIDLINGNLEEIKNSPCRLSKKIIGKPYYTYPLKNKGVKLKRE